MAQKAMRTKTTTMQQLKKIQVNDHIVIISHSVSHVPKYVKFIT